MPTAYDRFPEVWAVDFEFFPDANLLPTPVCCVALELRSGREIRLWGDELRTPPAMHPEALVIAYLASAEFGCYLQLGWPLPKNVIDFYVEFRNHINGRAELFNVRSKGLLGALSYFGLSHLDPDTKKSMRDRILLGGPYSPQERAEILDYCASDVYALRELLAPLTARMVTRPKWVDHALQRGRYMKTAAHMERTGVPLDLAMLNTLLTNWEAVRAELVEEIRATYSVYTGKSLDKKKLEPWARQQGIAWPRTPTGQLRTDKESLKQLAKAYPIVAPIRELQDSLGKMRLSDLQVGADGRNRAILSVFGTATARNAPGTAKFIFGPSAWMRSLMKPEPGRALAYIDWSSQEIAIAAALSDDQVLIDAYNSGDIYLAFAKSAKLVPEGATRETHENERERCKAMFLGINYGMQAESIARTAAIPEHEAIALLKTHKRTYAKFWAWIQRVTDAAMLVGHLDTALGWRLYTSGRTRPTSLMNHPMQSHGSEMLRLACCYLTEAGINVCAPVHDAVLIESSAENIERDVARARELMAVASRHVLGGFEVRTDFQIIRHPAAFSDKRGKVMWMKIQAILERLRQEDVCSV